MTKRLLILWLICAPLCGCVTTLPESNPIAPAVAVALSDEVPVAPVSSPSPISGEALQGFPLPISGTGLRRCPGGLILFSGTESSTTLTLLSGENLRMAAQLTLPFVLTPDDPSVQISGSGISYFDPESKQTVILDVNFEESRRIKAPDGLLGAPLLSSDQRLLYYCTSSAVRVLDTQSGISRVLKEICSPYQAVSGLWMEDSVLQCALSDGNGKNRSLFLSTQNGRLIYEGDDTLALRTWEDRYYASLFSGIHQQLLFGLEGESPSLLIPRDSGGTCIFLPENHAAVTMAVQSDKRIRLDYYDLSSGMRTASLSLDSAYLPTGVTAAEDGTVYFLMYDPQRGCDTLYLWNTGMSPCDDTKTYTSAHFTRENPDLQGLADCSRYAREIGEKYGIQILIYKDAAAVKPWDYDLEYEHLAPVLSRELELLDQRLSNYPEGFLQTLTEHFTGLKICIVRQITGSPESGSLATVNGIQFFEGYDAYIALAAGQTTEHALYHELCHLIDTVVLNESTAYDQWEKINPKGFSYDYDYAANQQRDGSLYLQEHNRSFIDTYAMSFPKEDRARIMEYAMTEGNAHYFQSPCMQAKLMQLCKGIREAFRLKKHTEEFLWEQYLHTPLAYKQ